MLHWNCCDQLSFRFFNQFLKLQLNPPFYSNFVFGKAHKWQKFHLSHLKLFLGFFFEVFNFLFLSHNFTNFSVCCCCCFSPKKENKKKTIKTWRCFMNAREIIDKNIKFFPSLFRRTHDTTKFFNNECASLRNNNTSTQTTFFLLSLFRRMLCFSFLRLVVCVKVAMCVFFVVFAPCYTTFSTTTVSQETFFFFLRKPRQWKRVFVRIVEKKAFQYWWFSAFM